MKPRFAPLLLLLAALPLSAQNFIPPAQQENATPGDVTLTDYFRAETARLSERCLADLKSPDDWQTHRPEFRRQLQEMLGLWPLPERTDLQAVVTGRIDQDEFTVEKIHFQASPGLYVTANLYLPKHQTNPAPAILYECGHWRLLTNGISYGNKAVYQFDGAWYARNGYVCLVLDSLLAGEIQGVHAGTRDQGLWWWNARGYTPAGVEAWFGIRALDYLCTRPEVDTNRFGITGHSGGGAYTWTITALDDRIKVAAPLSGLTDLQRHVCDNLMDSHCDCNFPINIYRWDFPQLAALAAPRPLLLGGTDNDGIFPLPGTLALHQKLSGLYKLLNASSNLAFCLAPGPHDEVPELRLAVLRWFNRHLQGVTKATEQPITVDVKKFLSPDQTRVFTDLPTDAINTNIADTFVPQHTTAKTAAELRTALREKVFAGWPEDDLPLDPKRAFSAEREGQRFSAWDFTSQHDTPLRLYILESTPAKSAASVSLTVLDPSGWTNWLVTMRGKFATELSAELGGSDPTAPVTMNQPLSPAENVTLAFLAPRGIGLTAWSGDDRRFTRTRRRFAALGQTLDGMRVWDIRRAIQTIHFVREGDLAQVELKAAGPMAVNALYAALFESSVRKLELTGLPKSHTEGPDFLGILKLTDLPQVAELVGGQAGLKSELK